MSSSALEPVDLTGSLLDSGAKKNSLVTDLAEVVRARLEHFIHVFWLRTLATIY